jgi:hypothetical protein
VGPAGDRGVPGDQGPQGPEGPLSLNRVYLASETGSGPNPKVTASCVRGYRVISGSFTQYIPDTGRVLLVASRPAPEGEGWYVETTRNDGTSESYTLEVHAVCAAI